MTTTLSNFGSGDAQPTGGLTGIAKAAFLTEPPNRENTGKWEAPDTEYGLTTHRHRGRYGGGKTHTAATHEVRWVSGGDLGGYVEKYGDKLLQIPDTYSGFSEFEPYLSCIDGLLTEAYGYGIDGTAAERALRVLIDNGRYNRSNYHIIACGQYPWVLIGDEGVLLCSTTPIGRTDSISRTVPLSLPTGEVDVEEENPTALTALRRVGAYLSGNIPDEASGENTIDTPISLEEHLQPPLTKRRSKYHKFTGEPSGEESETELRIKRGDLYSLGAMELDPHSVPGGNGTEQITAPQSGMDVEVSFTDPREIGESHSEGIVIGYSFDWECYGCSTEEVAVVTTYHLEEPSIDGSRIELTINTTHTRLATVTPDYKIHDN
ncbi:hypothetical protein [Haloarcula sp. 1CSR25-25]|jgi:hypothetical protein|uniref:hypothetical protein n=1 Tax=Haloarcula sp. 1CSR25-25 TaxID=2862545 RepID=UPI002896034A|nr:hypothetical protein [Haloarcula sp. 1CSR25-25]MDT3437776.1 hypothetical protein [Haloarcula sp. 1CSR25-25]